MFLFSILEWKLLLDSCCVWNLIEILCDTFLLLFFTRYPCVCWKCFCFWESLHYPNFSAFYKWMLWEIFFYRYVLNVHYRVPFVSFFIISKKGNPRAVFFFDRVYKLFFFSFISFFSGYKKNNSKAAPVLCECRTDSSEREFLPIFFKTRQTIAKIPRPPIEEIVTLLLYIIIIYS